MSQATKKSKSADDILSLVDPSILVAVLACALGLCGATFLAVGFGEGYFGRQFCLGQGCWAEFLSLFSLPISIFVSTIKMMVAGTTVVAIVVAVRNYVETKKLASAQVHLAHKESFSSFVAAKGASSDFLTLRDISTHSWYAYMCPLSHEGDLTVGDEYLKLMRELRDHVASTNNLILKMGRGYRHDRYQRFVIDKLKTLGIDIAGRTRLDFFSVEREAFALINEVNQVFSAHKKIIPLVPSSAHGIP